VYGVPTGHGKVDKIREFDRSGKGQGKTKNFTKFREG